MANTRIVIYRNKRYEMEYMSAREAVIRGNESSCSFQEGPLLERIASLGITGDYIDVGANIGNHSTFFNWHTKAEHIYSFEPHPLTYKVLVRNMKANGCDRVSTLNQAVWHKEGTLHMDDLPLHNAGRAQVCEVGGKFARKRKHKVPAVTLDSVFDVNKNRRKIGLIKMDVEDAESHVIFGGLRVLEHHKPFVVAEHHDAKFLDKCRELLEPLGYKLSPEKFEPRGETRLWIPS